MSLGARLRESPISGLISRTGLGPQAASIYYTLTWKVSDGQTQICVEGECATFEALSKTEYRRLDKLFGERSLVVDILNEVNSGDIYYDIGSHIGVHATFAGLRNASVVCFEPNPKNVERLERHAEMNGPDFNINSVALSDTSGTFTLEPQDYGVGDGGKLQHDEKGDGMPVDVVFGDQYIEEYDLNFPDVIKIDIEGSELRAIRGLKRALSDTRVLYCEVHPEMLSGGSPRDVESELADIGFDNINVLDEGANTYQIKAKRIALE